MRQFTTRLAVALVLGAFCVRDSGVARAVPLEASTREAPEIVGIEHWINSVPLSIAALRGKVIVVNFWTFDCENCQHTLSHLVQWYEDYKDRGLVIIGIHTPEFPHERGRAETEAAVHEHGIRYPVAQDNKSATWKAYGNRYWPAFYFIDAHGVIRYERFGEGGYDESEAVIRELLAEAKGAP